MPRPKKPHNLKVIAGTVRPDREDPQMVDLPLVVDAPPPDWLPNAHAMKEWNRLAPMLTANRLLTEAGTSVLGQMCALHGKLVQLWSAGEAPNSSLLAQYRGLVNDFGLTPAAHGKVKPSGGSGKGRSKFDGIGRRK